MKKIKYFKTSFLLAIALMSSVVCASVPMSTFKFSPVTSQNLVGQWCKIQEAVVRPEEIGSLKILNNVPHEWIQIGENNDYKIIRKTDFYNYNLQELKDIFKSVPSSIKYKIINNAEVQYLIYSDIKHKGHEERYTVGIANIDIPMYKLKKGDLVMGYVVDKDKPVLLKHFRKVK